MLTSETQLVSETLQALVFDPAFSELDRAFGTFCPFEAAGIENAEVRHGAFIATMLNPYRAARIPSSTAEGVSH